MAAGSVEGLITGVGAMRVNEFVNTFSEIKAGVDYSIKKSDNNYIRIGPIVKDSERGNSWAGNPIVVYKTNNNKLLSMEQTRPDGWKQTNDPEGEPSRIFVHDADSGGYIGKVTITPAGSTAGGRRKSRHRRSKKNRRTKRRKA